MPSPSASPGPNSGGKPIIKLAGALYQTFIELPYRSLTTPRQRDLSANRKQKPQVGTTANADKKGLKNGGQISGSVTDAVYQLYTSTESVSSVLAENPAISPGEAWTKVYGHLPSKLSGPHHAGEYTASEDDLKKAAACGNWGPKQPSELFLKMYHDAISSLGGDPAHGVVSPSLMGSCGVLPLTIISTLPDVMRHMSNCIVRAEREVFLATNFWTNSTASRFITDAMRELSRRAGERGTTIVFKIMYDRGSPKQLLEPHYVVGVKEYTGKKVNLPLPECIPNIDLQVINYHQPLLGTFHAKYMVVDRKIAILQSNNIQDNDNLEMMVHMEGPIVDSMYDMALISWHKRLEPPLPSHNSPASRGSANSFTDIHCDIFGPSGSIRGHNAIIDPAKMKSRQAYEYKRKIPPPGHMEATQTRHCLENDETVHADIVTGPSSIDNVVPEPQPVSTSNGQTRGPEQAGTTELHNQPDGKTVVSLGDGPQLATHQALMPAAKADFLPEHTTDGPHWDKDIASEVLRVQAAVSAKKGETTLQAVNRHLNHTINVGFAPSAPECSPEDEMTPYIPHPMHEPFPIAMVNRAPHGQPNHKSVSTPQNAAWLSALRNATKNVFIQSPTLNADPLVPAIIEACERGIDVYCYICLGYNDAGELLPMQGGHNDMVAHQLYTSLSGQTRKRLHYFWYVGKDQTKPIVQEKKKRSCHIKLMIVDEHIGIVGNANQDTQSWFHSQEINVMLDSDTVCRAWIDGLRRNQNTHLYGALDKETGIWTDEEGKMTEGAIGVNPGRLAWARGVLGAIKRVQGVGGF